MSALSQITARALAIVCIGLFASGCPTYQPVPTENPEALAAAQRGQEAGRQGHHEEALRHLEEAVRHDPSFAEGHRLAGFALFSLGRLEEAIEHYEWAEKQESSPEASQVGI